METSPLVFKLLRCLSGFVIGAVLGSLITMLSYRLPRGLSIIRPRSQCPACGTTLTPSNLVPIASWLLNRGKCHNCRTPIPQRYPLIELVAALLCASLFVTHLPGMELWFNLVLIVLGMTVIVIDLEDLQPNRSLFVGLLLLGFLHMLLFYNLATKPVIYPLLSMIVAMIAYNRGFAAPVEERSLWLPIVPVSMALVWFEPRDFLVFIIASTIVALVAEHYYAHERIERHYILAGLTFCWLLAAVT